MEYPTLFASAKQGWAQLEAPPVPFVALEGDLKSGLTGMTPLFEKILEHIPPPTHLDRSKPFSMLTVQIEADPYVGALYTGRIESGVVQVGDTLWALDVKGNKVGEGRVRKLFGRQGMYSRMADGSFSLNWMLGLTRIETEAAACGEIISIAGIKNGGVNITLVAPEGWSSEGPQPIPVNLLSLLLNYISWLTPIVTLTVNPDRPTHDLNGHSR